MYFVVHKLNFLDFPGNAYLRTCLTPARIMSQLKKPTFTVKGYI